MAVAGKMSELPLPELLMTLGGRRGKLRIDRVPNMALMEIHVDAGVITACMLDGRVLRKDAQVIDRLIAVAAAPSGEFQFQSADASELAHRLRMPVQNIALEIAQRLDEILGAKEEFPPDEQVLRWSSKGALSGIEDPGLREFVAEADDPLRYGVSSQRLAAVLQLSTVQVQYYLLQLARLGCIDAPGRDQLWSRLDASLRTRSSPVRLARGGASPAAPAAQPGAGGESWRSGKANRGGQKVIPSLRTSKDERGETDGGGEGEPARRR